MTQTNNPNSDLCKYSGLTPLRVGLRHARELIRVVILKSLQPVACDVPVQVIRAIHRHRQHRLFQC